MRSALEKPDGAFLVAPCYTTPDRFLAGTSCLHAITQEPTPGGPRRYVYALAIITLPLR